MKEQTKKIVLTKSGSVNKSVSKMISNCNFSTDKIYTGYYLGSGRFTTAHSAMGLIVQILSSQGYKFEKGNDAPKGGIKGEYLKVSKVAINFIKSLK